ncbi:nitroreductase family protein [Streptomyces sp. NPDC047000]|uniref:Acg family FMN-binding oxidoreductase n=1 Tax=Streptomyces sp. NPDC047000 TaxID=3155474 RepID=UPI0033E5F0BF
MQAQPLDTTTVTGLVAAATAAPSLHNAQPWRFRYRTATAVFELRPDLSRAMPRTDPDHRGLHLGCGAAVFNLRVAAAHAGLHTDTRILPAPTDPMLLATVTVTGSGAADAGLARLQPAVARRHTSRHPFEDRPVPGGLAHELAGAARQEGAQLDFPDLWHVEALLDHIHDVEGRDSLDPERYEDVRHWTRVGEQNTAAVDGVPDYAFGPRRTGGRAPVRDFADGRHDLAGRPGAVFETAPNLALLGTRQDHPADWLRAGQAMERILLLATLRGLATSLTSHSLERHDLRELARDPESSMGYVQMVLRLGYGLPGTASPRRPVTDVLEID